MRQEETLALVKVEGPNAVAGTNIVADVLHHNMTRYFIARNEVADTFVARCTRLWNTVTVTV